MTKTKRVVEVLPTTWDVSDELWDQIKVVPAEHDSPKAACRKRIDQRKVLNGIVFRMRSCCHRWPLGSSHGRS